MCVYMFINKYNRIESRQLKKFPVSRGGGVNSPYITLEFLPRILERKKMQLGGFYCSFVVVNAVLNHKFLG